MQFHLSMTEQNFDEITFVSPSESLMLIIIYSVSLNTINIILACLYGLCISLFFFLPKFTCYIKFEEFGYTWLAFLLSTICTHCIIFNQKKLHSRTTFHLFVVFFSVNKWKERIRFQNETINIFNQTKGHYIQYTQCFI